MNVKILNKILANWKERRKRERKKERKKRKKEGERKEKSGHPPRNFKKRGSNFQL